MGLKRFTKACVHMYNGHTKYVTLKEEKSRQKWVLGHLESLKTHLFIGVLGTTQLVLGHFWPNFMNFAEFSKYFAILGGRLPFLLNNQYISLNT